jgi:uncharacterized damage-inducible protein DinB
MITPAWVQMMADYNAEMNRRWYRAAETLDDAERRRDRGAFFGSIHGTLNHLLWGDRIWMSRFDGGERPPGGIKESVALVDDFPTLATARVELDAAIREWAARVDAAWLAGELSWFSGAAQRQVSRPTALLVAHMFNHQTHHRGQAHAMLTAAGARTEDTDLWLVAGA